MDCPILITGASGFIGAHLCTFFLERGHPVVAIEGPSDNHWRLPSHSRLRRLRLNLCSPQSVRQMVQEVKPSVVLNCAAYGAYSSQIDVEKIYRVNFDAVRTLLETLRELKGFRAFIQAGSSSEYGLNCSAPNENAHTVPDSNYAVSKVAATGLTQYFGKKLGFPAWTFRLYSVYGPLEEASRLIPKLLREVQQGKFPPLVNPQISRDFVYIDDICQAYLKMIEEADRVPKGEVFNIGTGIKTTLGELISTTREIFSLSAQPEWGSMPERHWDLPDWYSNPEKAARLLGWRARTSLREGLKIHMTWMNDHPELTALAVKNSILSGRKR